MNGFHAGIKKVLAIFFVVTAVIVTVTGIASAEVFLKGNNVEVGINDAGSFGTSGVAPSGFHPTNSRLGFVADPGRDGWSVGTPPQTGDYFVPGSPEEGWMIEWTSAGVEKQFHNFGLMGEVDVPLTSLTNTSSGDTRSAIWEGTASSGNDRLRITQTVSFNVNDLFFTMNVVLTNIGTTTLSSLEYMRNVDPDQEQPLTGNFSTKNWVEFQPGRTGVPGRPNLVARPSGNGNKALAIAEGLNYRLTLGLGTIDPRAVVAASHGFSNRDTDSILNTPIQPTSASPSTADAAIALAYDLGALAPGQSTSLTYAYILNKADLDAAMGNMAAVTILQPTGTVSGTNVLFQATTDKVPNTARMDFYVNGQLIGTDASPDAGGVFEATFDSLAFTNGTASLKAVATFTNGTSVEKTTSVSVDNSGPEVAFSTPVPGQVFAGNGIPVAISVLNPAHPPVRVSFFRETAGTGSLFLGEDTSAPFTSFFGTTGLPLGETVVIKAVAYDSLGRATSIAVSGTTQTNSAPVANAGTDIIASCTWGGTSAILNGLGSSDPDGDVLTYTWSGPFGTASGSTPSVLFGLGSHSVTLTVNDGKVNATDTLVVSVVDTTPPSVSAGPSVTLEATSPGGAAFSPSPVASDNCCDVNVLISPRPALYPLGGTTVLVAATDCAGNQASDSLMVRVVDTTPPAVVAPADVTVEATGPLTAVTLGTATTTDVIGVVSVINDAPAKFPVGVTTITWTAKDAAGNTGTASQKVTVKDTTAPIVTAPADVTAEATGILTTVAFGIAAATDNVGIATLTNDAPVTFPVGTTTVTWTAKDAAGNTGIAIQTVTVADATPPVLSGLVSQVVEATFASGAAITFNVTATDLVTPSPVVVCTPATGTIFAVGTTTVSCKATDAAGNSVSGTFTVKVQDTTSPVVTLPANLNVEATGVETVVNIGTATATDAVGVISLTNNAPAFFPLGKTEIIWTATDAAGNKGTSSQTVTVVDTTPPVLFGLVNQIVEAASTNGASGIFNVTAIDPVTPAPVVVCTPATGSVFAIGTTTVSCKATDAAGNSTTGSFTVKVQDTIPPVLKIPADIHVLLNTSPTAAAIQTFLAGASAVDKVDASVTITYSVPSFTSVGPKTVTFTAIDDYGNSSQSTATIWVNYGISGFLPPVSLGNPFKQGSTIPVKFQLADANGSIVTSATAKLLLQKFSNDEPVGEPIEVTSTSGVDTGNYFRLSDDMYMYNLYTKSLTTGLYQVRAVLDDGSVNATWLALK
jgi:HYR domain-containing protein/PKD domain-containing protein